MMIDVVLADNLPKARGIGIAVPAHSLKNFRQPKDAAIARSDCRAKDALIYAQGYELDDGAFKDLARHGGALVFSLSDVLDETGFRRAIVLSRMRLAFSQCRKSGCGFLPCTLAKSGSRLRTARELGAFMSVLGMNQHEKAHAIMTAERLVGK
jgi:RNase P/RNase MRP subunit p30